MFNKGDWVKWGDHIGMIQGVTKGGRYLIEYESISEPKMQHKKWVRYEYLTELDPAVSSLLSSIYQAV